MISALLAYITLYLTLRLPSMTIVLYANSLDPDETPSICVSPGYKLFDTQTTFSPTLSDIEAL